MSDVLRGCQLFSFDFIPFLVERYTVRGGARVHTHEYRHTPGGQIEKLGRKLYIVEADVVFSTDARNYPSAWPGDLSDLRDRFDQLVTSDLVIPTIGTIQAMCLDWPIDTDFKRRDGERGRFVFQEDLNTALIANNVVQVNYATLDAKFDDLVDESEVVDFDISVFEAIARAVDSISGLANDIEGGFGIVEQLDSLVTSCQTLDATVDGFNDPTNWAVAKALRSLAVTAITLRKDVDRRSRPMFVYEVPRLMTIADVSVVIYGVTTRAAELLRMNEIDDPFRLPPGTGIRAYVPEAIKRAA